MSANQASIQSFLDYLKFQKRYSQHTIISYQNDLKDFFNFIEDKYGSLSLTEISATLIRTWLANLKQNKITSKSINRKISTLKSFSVSYTHLRAHETRHDLVCRLLLEKK